MAPPDKSIKAQKSAKGSTPQQEAQDTVHKLGDAEITQTRQGDVMVFSVRGRYSPELLELLEKVLIRTRGDVGLDLRSFKGQPHLLVPCLRKVNRHFKTHGRVFLLYEPPSVVIDQLSLLGTADEFNIFSADAGLKTSKARASAEERGTTAKPEEAKKATHKIVSFTRDLDRAKQLESSLETAGRRSLLMAHSVPPEFAPFEISTSYYPHDKLGGDFLHLQLLGQDRMGILLGDVSGHGIEAALIMGMTKKVMEIRAREGSREDPADVMRRVNADIFPDLDHYTFVTAIYAILDRSTGVFSYARAGHNYPLLVSHRRSEILLLNSPGMAIGMDRGELFKTTLKTGTATVMPGDVVVIYTDGLTEAEHPRRGQYGVERLAQFFREAELARPVEEIKQALLDQVHEFLEGETLKDDLSLILIRHGG